MEKLDEDCGCGSTANNIRDYDGYKPRKYDSDPLVGKRVSLTDGRSGKVDDSIRNSVGEVIGYVIEGDRGVYRVFKDKIINSVDESGAMATLSSTPGMGEIVPPTPGKPGSGDQFPTLTVGTPAAKDKKKDKKDKKDDNPISSSLMNFKLFIKNSRSTQ
jgi:hypothetical protein